MVDIEREMLDGDLDEALRDLRKARAVVAGYRQNIAFAQTVIEAAGAELDEDDVEERESLGRVIVLLKAIVEDAEKRE